MQNSTFIFPLQISGENQFGAELKLLIWVPALIDDLLVAKVLSATGTQVTVLQPSLSSRF